LHGSQSGGVFGLRGHGQGRAMGQSRRARGRGPPVDEERGPNFGGLPARDLKYTPKPHIRGPKMISKTQWRVCVCVFQGNGRRRRRRRRRTMTRRRTRTRTRTKRTKLGEGKGLSRGMP
jgi:hypothetical protein